MPPWVVKDNLKGYKGLEIVGVNQAKKECLLSSLLIWLLPFKKSVSCQLLKSHPQITQYCYYRDFFPL